MKPENRFFSIPEAAARCGVNRATMWNWVKSGRVKAFVTPGGHHRILQQDVDNLLATHPESAAHPSEPALILVVDDDPMVCDSLRKKLERRGYRAETATDGFQAGVKTLQQRPDLVVLDLYMDGMDGFDVCRTIKNNSDLKQIKVLAITGADSPETKARIMAEGADGYAPKGNGFDAIFQQIESILGFSRGVT